MYHVTRILILCIILYAGVRTCSPLEQIKPNSNQQISFEKSLDFQPPLRDETQQTLIQSHLPEFIQPSRGSSTQNILFRSRRSLPESFPRRIKRTLPKSPGTFLSLLPEPSPPFPLSPESPPFPPDPDEGSFNNFNMGEQGDDHLFFPAFKGFSSPSDPECIANGFEPYDGWLQCPFTGRCVQAENGCNGVDECGDGFDEHNSQFCPVTVCNHDHFTFPCEQPNPQCLHSNYTCDGVINCRDGADEQRDMCRRKSHTCLHNEFACNKGGCVSLSLVCDGTPHCRDGSDEDVPGVCPVDCNNGKRCKNNRCVPECCICNGVNDCEDGGSDEEGCPKIECAEGEFQCSASGGCIPLRLKCDRVNDCINNSDEDPRICQALFQNNTFTPECQPHEFLCHNQMLCIPRFLVDDGEIQCADGSDELQIRSHSRLRRSTDLLQCTNQDGTVGQCMKIYDCPEALESARKGIYPQTCNMKIDGYVSVCCAMTVGTILIADTNQRIRSSNRKISDFESLCGIVDSPNRFSNEGVINQCQNSSHPHLPGQTMKWCTRSEPGEFGPFEAVGGSVVSSLADSPWMVSFGSLSKDNQYINHCGGTLITDRHVLTAAHCFQRSILKVARIRDLDLSTDTESPHLDFGIKTVHIHPSFNFSVVYNDIAVVELSKSVPFSRYIRPACLPPLSEPVRDSARIGTATGFGQTSFGGEASNYLLKWSAPVYNLQACARSYLQAPFLNRKKYPYGFNSSMFCAGYERGGVDACLGDSGGGYIVPSASGRSQVIGVVSFGIGCGAEAYPGIYTTVSHYIPWIKQVVEL